MWQVFTCCSHSPPFPYESHSPCQDSLELITSSRNGLPAMQSSYPQNQVWEEECCTHTSAGANTPPEHVLWPALPTLGQTQLQAWWTLVSLWTVATGYSLWLQLSALLNPSNILSFHITLIVVGGFLCESEMEGLPLASLTSSSPSPVARH